MRCSHELVEGIRVWPVVSVLLLLLLLLPRLLVVTVEEAFLKADNLGSVLLTGRNDLLLLLAIVPLLKGLNRYLLPGSVD
ncbi:hypothetical protein FB192DRAFT_1357592, partial [Mucor lusitanicus]